MSRRLTSTPRPPSAVGEHAGRPYLLWLPDSPPPWPGMVIVHGAGSQKENHGDFGRACAAAGWAALAYDQRGHGDSAEEMSPEALADVGRMARFLGAREDVDGERTAYAARAWAASWRSTARRPRMRSPGWSRSARPANSTCCADCGPGRSRCAPGTESRAALEAWLGEHDLRDAVALVGAKPLLLVHARGDERIPSEWSEELYEHAVDPRKLIVLPGGHHRSAQHDPELQGLALRWLSRNLA